jgi:alpha-L-rhamnosidase
VWSDVPVTLTSIEILEEAYPWPAEGRFESDDPLLDRIWQIGADTLRANMTDAYADPWRERGQWWGDAYVGIRINRAAAGDRLLWRRGLVAMADAVQTGPFPALAPNSDPEVSLLDYVMLWVKSADEYVGLTGDRSMLSHVLPLLGGVMSELAGWENERGLLDLPPGHWREKALIDWAGQFDREGEITALNALYAGTLDAAASIASQAGDPRAAVWSERAEAVRAAIVTHLRDPDAPGFLTARVAGAALPAWRTRRLGHWCTTSPPTTSAR